VECGVVGEYYETPYCHPQPSINGLAKNSVGLGSPHPHWCQTFPLLLTLVGWSLVSVSQKNKISTHVVLQCPMHRPPHGLHRLMVLDDEAIDWLLNTCPKI